MNCEKWVLPTLAAQAHVCWRRLGNKQEKKKRESLGEIRVGTAKSLMLAEETSPRFESLYLKEDEQNKHWQGKKQHPTPGED